MPYALALMSAVLYGSADFLGGLASRTASTLAVVFLSQGVGLVLLAVLLPWLPGQAPGGQDLLWGGLAGLAGGSGVALLYRALAVGTMGIVAPTTALFAVAIPVCVALALGERPGLQVLAGIGMAAVAIVLVSRPPASGPTRPTASRRPSSPTIIPLPPGFVLAVASGVAIGIFYLALARTAREAGLWPLLAARVVSVIVFGAAAFLRAESVSIPRALIGSVVGAGALDMAANAAYLIATRSGALSPVVTLASLYPASTVILAWMLLGERLSRVQRAGVACALVAVITIVSAA